MKFGLGVPALILYKPVMHPWEPDATPADIVRVARRADERGLEWLVIPEHIVMPGEMAEIMGPRYPEGLSAAAFLAGATTRVRMLTYILVLPYRNPVMLAKQIATVDWFSGGRMTLGLGAGHLKREFEILGVPFERRGKLTDEYLRAMKELWTADEPSFQGEHVRFENVVFEPRPVQKPHPPLLIGGNSRPAMRRAAALGDGWLPWLIQLEQLPGALEYIREQPGFQERDRPFEVVMPLARLNVEDYSHRELGKTEGPRNREQMIARIGAMRGAGVTGTLVGPGKKTRSVEEYLEWIDWFAEDVAPLFSE
ncbi:MAG: LLM class F420-dependent oxidoreductase [Dehalococcoidia bacterium]